MKEHPILFNQEMVRAVLDGRKTETRRVIKPQPSIDGKGNFIWKNLNFGQDLLRKPYTKTFVERFSPYGGVGDRLYVRETFSKCGCNRCAEYWPKQPPPDQIGHIHYPTYQASHGGPSGLVWKPSIHMPRWASRLTLEVANVGIEWVQEITTKEAMAEGIQWGEGAGSDPRVIFSNLWDSINAKRGYGWNKNPWVWVVKFKVLEVGK